MDPVGPTSDKIADQRTQIRAALEKHAPALVNRYDAALRLVGDETFPWRLRLVAHAVREIANALPEELLGVKAGRDPDALLDEVTRVWERDVSPSPADGPGSPAASTPIPPAGVSVPADTITKLDEYFRTRARSSRRRDAAEALFAWSDPFNRAQLASLGPVLKAWLEATSWFVAKTHAPRKLGPDQDIDAADERELPKRFAAFERALHGLLGGFFAVQADIEAIVADRGPAGLDDILPLLAGAEQRRQFLNRLDDPAWIEPLEQRGFFARPEEPVSDAEGSKHPVWPALRYLWRMATRLEAQEQVARIAAGLPDTENVTVRRDLVEIALVLPPRLSIPIANKARGWLGGLRPYGLPLKLGTLAVRLVEGGHADEALGLWDTLLRFAPRPAKETDGWLWPPEVDPQVEPSALRTIIKQSLPQLVAVRAREVVTMLSRRLSAALKARRQADDENDEDHLYIWLHDLSNDGSVGMPFEVVLVCALRDAAIQAVEGGRLTLSDVLVALEAQPWHVFKRLAMHLVERFADQGAGDVARYLTDRSLLERLDAEYQRLLHRAFPLLTSDERGQILLWIQQGPAAHQDDGSAAAADLDDEHRRAVDHWRWRRLGLVAADLPDDWLPRWSHLREGFGEPPPPGTDLERGSFGQVAFKSPWDADTLRALPVAEQLDRIRAWRPSADAPFTDYEGLRETLSSLVAQDPSRYAADARLFVDLPATIVRGLIGGLAVACDAQRPFPWEPVLDLGRWIVGQPAVETVTVTWGKDPGWAWTWSALAQLLSGGFSTKSGPAGVPRAHRKRAAEIVAALMLSPPSGKKRAFETLVDYALWIRREASPTGPLGADLPEVERLLVAELGPHAPPETYLAFGALLPWLLHLDPTWVAAHREEIFPAAPARAAHWQKAWSGFVRSHQAPPHRWYPILRSEYARAVEDLAESVAGQDRAFESECLAWHLIVLYLWSDIDVAGPDPLMARFFAVAPLSLRSNLLWQAAQGFENALKLGPQVIDRLMALWADRMAKAETDARAREELPVFGWWFAGGHFDEAWALEQLESVLRLRVTPQALHEVVKKLAELAPSQPLITARLLDLLADTPHAALDAVLWLDDARHVLAEAVRCGDTEAYTYAMAARDRLGKAGFAEVRQILPLSQDMDDPQAIPYFLWDEPMTVSRFRERLLQASEPERLRLLAKLLREARDPDVWRFTTPAEVDDLWPRLAEKLGRKREFWESLLAKWREKGLLARP
jgi:hypothetical protein